MIVLGKVNPQTVFCLQSEFHLAWERMAYLLLG